MHCRGQLGIVQYSQSEHARFSLKIYKVCMSVETCAGYTCTYRLHTGKDRSEMPSSQKAIMSLSETAGLSGT